MLFSGTDRSEISLQHFSSLLHSRIADAQFALHRFTGLVNKFQTPGAFGSILFGDGKG